MEHSEGANPLSILRTLVYHYLNTVLGIEACLVNTFHINEGTTSSINQYFTSLPSNKRKCDLGKLNLQVKNIQ